jgi:hypothetical protein
MSFDDWQNDPHRLLQLLKQEWQRTGKLRAELRRWNLLAECAFIVVDEDGEVMMGLRLAEDVESLAGATDTERRILNGDDSTGCVLSGADVVVRLLDATPREAP